jgi:hypothetical protein
MMVRFATVAALIALATAASAQSATFDELRGDGSWNPDGEAKVATQQWSLDLKRSDDGTVSGLITVTDSPLFSVGRVHGKLEDRVISGTITDEQGNHVAQFNGTLSRSGFRGKYVDRTGESGEWEWEGKLPE